MRKYLFAALLSLALFSITCKHKTPEPIPPPAPTPPSTTTGGGPPTPTVPTGPVNKVDSICYNEKIQPILDSSCATSGCHAGDNASKKAGVILDSYEHLMATVSKKILLESINEKTPAPFFMPPTGSRQLTPVEKTMIEKWISEGMKNNIDCVVTCDTTDLSFKDQVFSVFQINCTNACHNTQSPTLRDYNEIKSQVDNGNINCVLTPGCTEKQMPPTYAPMPACDKKQILKWIEQGAKNN